MKSVSLTFLLTMVPLLPTAELEAKPRDPPRASFVAPIPAPFACAPLDDREVDAPYAHDVAADALAWSAVVVALHLDGSNKVVAPVRALAGPSIPLSGQEPIRAAASSGLRLGLPYLGVAIMAKDCDGLIGCYAGSLAGASLGYFAALSLDAGLWGEPKAASNTALVPVISASEDSGSLGFLMAF